MSSCNFGTNWNEETKWLIISNDMLTTLQTTELFHHTRNRLMEPKSHSVQDEFAVTQKPQLAKMSFKDARGEIRKLSLEAELKRAEYRKKRADLISILDYDE